MPREDGPKELVIYVNRHGRPCDSERHDAVPLNVVPASAYDEARARATATYDALVLQLGSHKLAEIALQRRLEASQESSDAS